MKHVGKYLN
jgi:vacuolar protein sorting-associated protein 13A/C